MKHNAKNERIKRQYFTFLSDAKGQNSATVDGVAMALSRFEDYIKNGDFKKFHYQQAKGFKAHLAKQLNKSTGKPLSRSTLHTTLRHVKSFFQWLCQQTGYKSSLQYGDMEYFNLSTKDARIATTRREKLAPTIEQIRHVLDSMEVSTPIQRRNRALIAFTLLSGARDAAIASMKLKHVDLAGQRVIQDAREVDTKFSKSFTSYFFPVGEDIIGIVADWINYLRSEALFGNDDPLFPKTRMIVNEQQQFEASGLKREHWTTTNPIRDIFKEAFTQADLDYFNPHSFRDTLASLGEQRCNTVEQFKAWSQNLGHTKVLTTFMSYGEVQPQKQSEIFEQFRNPQAEEPNHVQELARAVALEIRNQSVV
ncbi:site-specific recombinase XerD [Arenicella xantha]|uniref:Site-specific recombinase XerD n=2 Tax=Arenicella xantha TaxID=644221 RepID=A0A395JJ95_9GAMM|nr:site-specific recombinase XerD [Arenicella xantha]